MNDKLSIAFAALGWQGSLFLIFEDGMSLQHAALAGIPTIIFVIYFFSVRRWISRRQYGLAYAAAFAAIAASTRVYISVPLCHLRRGWPGQARP